MRQLILGGTRSGKSALAERRAQQTGKRLVYVATAFAGDEEMRRRIDHHRARRGSEWQLVEETTALGELLAGRDNPDTCVLIDCLTLWLSNCLARGCWASQRERLLEVVAGVQADVIMVSNEVGSGIVPLGQLSREFADESGRLHQSLAGLCERVTLVVAGLPLELKPAALTTGAHNCTHTTTGNDKTTMQSGSLPQGFSQQQYSQQWFSQPAAAICRESLDEAGRRQARLTKPAGSLGRLEQLAQQFAGWQGAALPRLDTIAVRVFAGDHGVCARGVSAFPQAVTAQMIDNFLCGGAAISVLSRQLGADFQVVNMGTLTATAPSAGLVNVGLMPGTRDFTREPAMTGATLDAALQAGRDQIPQDRPQLFIGGDMGIGNTTAAAAIYCALLDLTPAQAVGPGTGVDRDGLQRKQGAVTDALALHAGSIPDPYRTLQCLGGLEIAALTGSFIGCAQRAVPVLVDGYIATAAALVALRLNPSVAHWLLFSHRSAEPAHALALEAMGAQPLLDLQMRLGEGSGAAVAVPLLRAALALHSEMATFDQAGVSNG